MCFTHCCFRFLGSSQLLANFGVSARSPFRAARFSKLLRHVCVVCECLVPDAKGLHRRDCCSVAAPFPPLLLYRPALRLYGRTVFYQRTAVLLIVESSDHDLLTPADHAMQTIPSLRPSQPKTGAAVTFTAVRALYV